MLTINEEGITAEILSSMVGEKKLINCEALFRVFILQRKCMRSLYMEVWEGQKEGISAFLHRGFLQQ